LACLNVKREARLSARTKGEIFAPGRSWQAARSSIQGHARKVYLKAHPQPTCLVCGYAKHVEVCHLRDVADWPDDATLAEINHLENLVGLCPTHHWELDHGALDEPLVAAAGLEPATP
jgi:hypothetical protein